MRDTIIKELQKEYKQLLFLKDKIQDQLKNVPTGRIKTSKNRNQMLYYIKEGNKWKYLKKEDQEIARQIAMRDYNEAVLRKVLEQEKQVKQVLEKYDPRAIEKQYDSLSEGRKRLVKPWIEPEEMFVEKWLAKKYKGNDYWENTQEIYTQKGERVRSKSEKIIADKLYQSGVPYRYECPIYLKGRGEIYPDFLCLNRETRKEIVWEHFGMMGDEEYCSHAMKKIGSYAENGYIQGRNLIMTFESAEKVLNTKEIDRIIQVVFPAMERS